MAQLSPLPDVYYAIFRYYEPLIILIGFIGTLMDPVAAHNQQAPWPTLEAVPTSLPTASIVTTLQLAHVCMLLGLFNWFVLAAVREHIPGKAAQEKILTAYFTPLIIGDFAHISVTLWALGEDRWNFARWTFVLWCTVGLGLSLLVPRLTWCLGIGRYVDKRDRVKSES